MTKRIVIKATVLYDGKTKSKNQYIIVEDNLIKEVTSKKMKYDYRGIVTPAFVDAHCHIGMDRDGEPYTESEANDYLSQFNPLNDPINSIYLDDRAFSDAMDFGVLYSCIVPGSGNLIGGKAKTIKHYAKTIKDVQIDDYGYKMALGYNPRSTTDWKGSRPNTRMGVYALLEKKFDDVLAKFKKAEISKEKKLYELDKKQKKKKLPSADYKKEIYFINMEFDNELSAEDKAILDMLGGKKTIKIHVHKEDDVMYLIHLVKKYNLKVTAEHTGDVFHKELFDELAKNNIPIVYGPLGALGYKVELKHAYYQNAKLLMESDAFFGLMTDHPVVHSYTLRDSLKFFLVQGMKDYEAISLITYKNAKILNLDDRLGTIEAGKWASIIVWDKEPLSLEAYPKIVIAEGKIIRNNM